MGATQYHDEVTALLNAIPNLGGRVHDTYAPDTLPEDSLGYVLPYVIVGSGVVTDLELERDLTGRADTTVHDWRAQINCVGPTPNHARLVAEDVIAALTNARVGNHWILPDNDAMRARVPVKDDEVKPPRFFLPLFWRLTTTT